MKQSLLLTSSLAAFFIFTSHSIAEVAEPRGMNHPLRETLRDMDQVRADAEEVLIRSRYCRPPHQPQKQTTAAELDALQTRLNALRTLVNQQELTFNRAAQDKTGIALRAAFPRVGGIDPPEHGTERESVYWKNVKEHAVPAQEMINAKRDALRKARLDDCRQSETSKTEIVVQPPLPPTPPPPPPEPPKERSWDPMSGLKEPTYTAVPVPVPPKFFCSEQEKAAMLAQLEPAKAELQRQADSYEAYAQQIEARKAQLASEGMPKHWQDSMDYEARKVRAIRDERLGAMSAIEQSRYLISITEVRDCSTTPKDGDKIGWDFKIGGEYGVGELKFPDGGYLGVEDTGTTERINVPLNWTPWQIFPDFGATSKQTRLGASITRTSANASRWGQFDPMGDTLFIPGLSDDIADTFSLPSTFNATIRDNLVDDFRYAGEFRRSEFGLKISEDFVFPGCNDFTLTKTFGLNQSWLDRRETFSAEVLDYFPIASPGFNVRADYHSALDSSTTALKLGFDGAYAPKDWGGLYLSAGLSGWVGYTDTDGTAALQLDVNGGITEQGAEFSRSDTTFGYQLKGAIGVDFGFGKAELGVEYRNDGDTPVIDYGAGAEPRIRHEEREELIGVLRTTFSF
jgi:hypothetical protein